LTGPYTRKIRDRHRADVRFNHHVSGDALVEDRDAEGAEHLRGVRALPNERLHHRQDDLPPLPLALVLLDDPDILRAEVGEPEERVPPLLQEEARMDEDARLPPEAGQHRSGHHRFAHAARGAEHAPVAVRGLRDLGEELVHERRLRRAQRSREQERRGLALNRLVNHPRRPDLA